MLWDGTGIRMCESSTSLTVPSFLLFSHLFRLSYIHYCFRLLIRFEESQVGVKNEQDVSRDKADEQGAGIEHRSLMSKSFLPMVRS